jgi:hypothetical protein
MGYLGRFVSFINVTLLDVTLPGADGKRNRPISMRSETPQPMRAIRIEQARLPLSCSITTFTRIR